MMTTTDDLSAIPDDDHLVWVQDPVELALQASSDSRRDTWERPEIYPCVELGRRLLLAQLEFSDWVLRRVECVRFERDRSVSRTISVEIVVRADAPVFLTANGRRVYLVPLSIMRRRTLVNFNIEEGGTRLPMLGLRLTQQLDASMLTAAAATASSTLADHERVKKFIAKVAAGTADVVDDQIESFSRPRSAHLKLLAQNALFSEFLHRLHRNFSLYVCLDVAQGRHRILNLSFEEPTYWQLQKSKLTRGGKGELIYEPGEKVFAPVRFWWYMTSKLGLRPTRFRFQIPAAENAASYHFEAMAPPGVRIVKASLLAGRPHEPDRHVSADRIVSHKPTVGLHAVEIPNNSLCRVQLDLRVPSRGWLTQLVTSCGLILAVLAALVLNWPSDLRWTENQITNVIVILVAASAATATLVAQREFHGLGAFMVTWLRAIGVISLLLPILAAGYLVYEITTPQLSPEAERDIYRVMWLLCLAALILFVIPSCALVLSWYDDRVRSERASPWDMTAPRKTKKGSAVARQRSEVLENYCDAMKKLKFDSPAIALQSAEGWHDKYSWTDAKQEAAVCELDKLRVRQDLLWRRAYCSSLRIGCSMVERCPSRSANAAQAVERGASESK
jgi:hypothetical protein